MRDRVLLVGEDFGNADPRYRHDSAALTGASGRRLASLAGYQGPNAMLLFMLDFARTNVVETADQWSDVDAVLAGVRRVTDMRDDGFVRMVLLGRRVARAFGRESQPLFEWCDLVAVVPHPSGRSHWWNEPENVRAARAFMRAARATT